MSRRVATEIGNLRRLNRSGSLSFSDEAERLQPSALRVAAYIVLASLVTTGAVAPWILALRKSPRLAPSLAEPQTNVIDPRISDQPLPSPPLSETVMPRTSSELADRPMAERIPPSVIIKSEEEAPRSATDRKPPLVEQIPVGKIAPSVPSQVTPPIIGRRLSHFDEMPPLKEALLLPPVLAPTLGPSPVLQARAPAASPRHAPLPVVRAPLRPSPLSVDPLAAEQTATITSLPKPARPKVDTSAAVRASLHRSRDGPDSKSRLSEKPTVPWKLPSVLAPTD